MGNLGAGKQMERVSDWVKRWRWEKAGVMEGNDAYAHLTSLFATIIFPPTSHRENDADEGCRVTVPLDGIEICSVARGFPLNLDGTGYTIFFNPSYFIWSLFEI